jgi:hypothetical protein
MAYDKLRQMSDQMRAATLRLRKAAMDFELALQQFDKQLGAMAPETEPKPIKFTIIPGGKTDDK